MTKRDWYKLGLTLSIVMYLIIFIVVLVNYVPKIEKYNNIERSRKSDINPNGFLWLKESTVRENLRSMRNTFILLNPFWIGIVNFGVLLSKTK